MFVRPCCKWRGGFRSVGSWNSPPCPALWILSIFSMLPHPPFRIASATSSGPRFLRSTWHPDSKCTRIPSCKFPAVLRKHACTKMCKARASILKRSQVMIWWTDVHHLVDLLWPLILPSKGCTSQATFATSSKGSQMTTFPGGSTARTAATPDTPRKEGQLCCQLPLKLTCRQVPETCKLQSSKTSRKRNRHLEMRLHLGLIFLPQAPCPPKISTSWQPLAAREVSTAMAHNSEGKVPGPGRTYFLEPPKLRMNTLAQNGMWTSLNVS